MSQLDKPVSTVPADLEQTLPFVTAGETSIELDLILFAKAALYLGLSLTLLLLLLLGSKSYIHQTIKHSSDIIIISTLMHRLVRAHTIVVVFLILGPIFARGLIGTLGYTFLM